MPDDLVKVVDCGGGVHIVRRDEYAAGVARLATYYKSGKRIAEFPAPLRYRPAAIQREAIASVAIRSRKRTALDDKIARLYRPAIKATARFAFA